MKRSNLYIGLYLFLVFLSGVLVGGIAYRLYSTQVVVAGRSFPRNAEDYRRHYIEEMHSRLKLRDDQVRQLDAILDATREQYRAVHQKYDPEMKAVQAEQVSKIETMLDSDQRAEYHKMREERAKRHEQSPKRKGPRPGC